MFGYRISYKRGNFVAAYDLVWLCTWFPFEHNIPKSKKYNKNRVNIFLLYYGVYARANSVPSLTN